MSWFSRLSRYGSLLGPLLVHVPVDDPVLTTPLTQLPPSEPESASLDGKPPSITHPAAGSSVPVVPDTPAWKRLISRGLPPHEAIPLIEAIFINEDEVKTIRGLCGEDAQTFVNRMHEVCFVFFLSRDVI